MFPQQFLNNIDADSASRMITAAADVALVVDNAGIVRDLAVSSEELAGEGYARWIGQPWVQTVAVDSKVKVEELLRQAEGQVKPQWRQVNHPSPNGADVPILYSAIRLRTSDVVAIGRNLRPVAALQQRLVEAQQSLERDYARMRHAETRYRMLFRMGTEAIVIVEDESYRVIEANPAAAQLFGESSKQLLGKTLLDRFDKATARRLEALLSKVRSAGRAEDMPISIGPKKFQHFVSASAFRQLDEAHFLVRFYAPQSEAAVPNAKSTVVRAIEGSPDGFVVTGLDGRVITANRAFLDMVQFVAEDQVRGKSLSEWLGRPGADLSVLLSNLKQHGSVRLFATTVRGEYGDTSEVEISAVSVAEAEEPCLGFTIRGVGRRLPAARSRIEHPATPSLEQLTELIGRVPLKDIVRETTDVIERMCIEAALELTQDNRAVAAEMLGLSRQSLYMKLHRYGLGELGSDAS